MIGQHIVYLILDIERQVGSIRYMIYGIWRTGHIRHSFTIMYLVLHSSRRSRRVESLNAAFRRSGWVRNQSPREQMGGFHRHDGTILVQPMMVPSDEKWFGMQVGFACARPCLIRLCRSPPALPPSGWMSGWYVQEWYLCGCNQKGCGIVRPGFFDDTGHDSAHCPGSG
jgi:hypothetical protein